VGLVGLDMWRDLNYGDTPPILVAILLLVIHFIAVEFISFLDGFTHTKILYLTIPFPAFFMLGKRTGYMVTAALLVWVTAKFFIFKTDWLSDLTSFNNFTLILVSMALISIMAQTVTNERKARQRTESLLSDLEASHQQLSDYSEQVTELATVAERNRLARDIHDSLGHYLTIIGIQLQKAQVIFDDAPDEALKSIGNAAQMTDQALKDVRVSVGILRQDAQKFSLRKAMSKIGVNWRDLSFNVDWAVDGNEALYTHQQLMTLYRAVQEGVTNIQRHAQATKANVQVTFTEEVAQLVISDNGVGLQQGHSLLQGGGLRGLRERLAQVDGRLTVSRNGNGGTRLAISIPRLEGGL